MPTASASPATVWRTRPTFSERAGRTSLMIACSEAITGGEAARARARAGTRGIALRGEDTRGGLARTGRAFLARVRSARGRRLALAVVDPLGDLLDRLGAEGVEIVRLAARHETAVDVHLLVDPVPARVADVGLETRPRSERSSIDDVRLDQGPWRVADRGHRLSGLEERAGESDGVFDRPQGVRIGHAARKHECVVVVRIGLCHRLVDVERVGLVEVVERLHLP